jgi:hypothetical protein
LAKAGVGGLLKTEGHHTKWNVEVPKCCKYRVQNPANTMQYESVYLPNVADAMQNESF